MKTLVTGAGGFAGRHLLRALGGGGGEYLIGTVADAAELERARRITGAGVEWVVMDVTSDSSIAEVVRRFDPDRVYHLAGQASVGESFATPLRTWEVNATGTLRLLTALGEMRRPGRRFLLASSAEVYGVVEASEQPIRESRPVQPVSPYGSSKAAAEIVARQTGRLLGIDVVVARSFNHIGPGQDERFVLASIGRQLSRMMRDRDGERRLKVGNLEVRRDFLDVRDVVAAYARVMERGIDGEVYNICSGVSRSLADIVARLVELSGTGARIEVDPARVRAADVPCLTGDPGKLKSLDWTPTFPLDDTLRDILQDAGENG